MPIIKFTVEAEYTTDGRQDQEHAALTALNLAFCPNLHTVEEGVQIISATATDEEGHEITQDQE